MTDFKKNDLNHPWQTEDIRATNVPRRWRIPSIGLKSLSLLLLDTTMLFTSWVIADRIGTPTVGVHLADSTIPILAASIGTLTASGFYGTDDKLRRFAKLFKSLIVAQIIVLITVFFYQPGAWVSRSVFSIALVLNFIFIGGGRFLFDLVTVEIRKHNPIFQQSIVLIGDRVDIDRVRKLLQRSQQFKIDSIIDLAVWDIHSQLDRVLMQIRSRQVSEVFICSQHSIDNQIILFWKLKAAGIHLRIVPTELQLPQRSAEIKMIEEIPTVRFKSLPIFGINFQLKRLFDTIASLLILIAISPLLLVVAILIKKSSPGPIFYRQHRVGLKGNHFQVWKFRTMVANASQLQQQLEAQNEVKGGVLFKIKHDPRITKIGKFLRDYSLDELPQLFNVLQGQMSLVGPRPLPIRDYELSLQPSQQFAQNRLLRYEVLPGITGLWQVKGRANVDSDDIFYWDMVYIMQWSLTLDVKILLQTIKVVLLKEGSC
ncbi:sugar transferase [Chamaesiphon sp.]|uniref:sugar transferase n=1 Tax=Chamaesiphon sp. TaxID=2814140 RepID=UPI0035948047